MRIMRREDSEEASDGWQCNPLVVRMPDNVHRVSANLNHSATWDRGRRWRMSADANVSVWVVVHREARAS